MRWTQPLVVAALLASLAACADDTPTVPLAPRAGPPVPRATMNPTTSRVVGYFPTYDGAVGKLQLDKLTHVIYAFALPTDSGTLTNIPMSGDARLDSLVQRGHAAGVKVLVSVGGGVDSLDAIFRGVAANATLRARLVSRIVTFVTNYGLDGVDMDWEYPTASDEVGNFGLLMRSLSYEMHSRGKLLTAAVGATWGDAILPEVADSVDFLTLMAYALDTAPHSPYSYAVDALDYWLGHGLPASKAVLGVAFYGKTSGGLKLSYRELVHDYAQAPYADVVNGYYYNGLTTIQRKTALALQRGSGVAIWELSEDTTAAGISLLGAIQEQMNGAQVYSDALNGLWEDWSWDVSRNWAATSPVYAGTKSLAATYTAAWGGVYLFRGTGVSPYLGKIEFYVHGGTAGGQQLRVQLADTGGWLTKLPIDSYIAGGSVAAGTWRKVSIPLSSLGVTTNRITKLVIQDGSGSVQPTFYVDEISFVP